MTQCSLLLCRDNLLLSLPPKCVFLPPLTERCLETELTLPAPSLPPFFTPLLLKLPFFFFLLLFLFFLTGNGDTAQGLSLRLKLLPKCCSRYFASFPFNPVTKHIWKAHLKLSYVEALYRRKDYLRKKLSSCDVIHGPLPHRRSPHGFKLLSASSDSLTAHFANMKA